jgi:hypothetical protein
LIPKKIGQVLQKIAKNRLFFSILYLGKETTVVAENFGDTLNIVRAMYGQSFKLKFLCFDFSIEQNILSTERFFYGDIIYQQID